MAVVTNGIGNGKPVFGCRRNSNSRCGQDDLIRERICLRTLKAASQGLLEETDDNFNQHKIPAASMNNEQPGGQARLAGMCPQDG